MQEIVVKISCNVIKDLIPSYIDEICSDESRNLIDEHIKNCTDCQSQLELLKNTAFTDEKGEGAKISYLKKVKKYYVYKEIISLAFLTLVIICAFKLMIQSYGYTEHTLLYIFFPLLIIASYSLSPDNMLSAKHTKLSCLTIITSIVMTIYCLGMICLIVSDDLPFAMPPDKIGPFFGSQMYFIMAMQIAIFILSCIMCIKGYYINKCINGLTLTGACLAAGYICLSHNCSELEYLRAILLKTIVYIIIEGIAFSIAAHYFNNKIFRGNK